MHYLIRVEPFTSLHVQLQSGRCSPGDGGQVAGWGCRGRGRGSRQAGPLAPFFSEPHLFPSCPYSPNLTLVPVPLPALTALTGSSTRWQLHGRPVWKAQPM